MSTGSGRVYKRGNVWWIDYGYRGKRKRESSGSTRKKDATALLRRRLAEIGQGKLIGPEAEKVTFGDLEQMILDDYRINGRKSTKRLRTALKHLRATFGEMRALDITTDRIRRYIAERQEEAADATIQKELAALKRAFTLAVQAQRLHRAPHVPSIEVDNVREHFLTMADIDAVCEHLSDDLRPVVRFASLTGWRKSEVLGLTWARVDFDRGTVRLAPGTTKNKEGRTFPMHALPELERLLREQREATRALERQTGDIIPWVFHRDGERIRTMRYAWNTAAKAAGLTWIDEDGQEQRPWFHDLRRTAVRDLEAAGVARSVAMKLTGHRTESVFRRYAIADEVALTEGVKKVARLRESRSEERSVIPISEAMGS